MWKVVTWALICCASLSAAESVSQQIIEALRGGNPAQARTLSDDAVRHDPQNAELWGLNGLARLQMHDNEGALRSFNQALRYNPQSLLALEGAAQILYAQGSQDAVPLLKKVAQQRPSDLTSHAMLASLAYRRRDCPAALAEFALSGEAALADVRALREKGACLLEQKKADEAVDTFQQALNKDKDEKRSRYDLALAQFAANRFADARQTLEPLTASNPPDSRALNLASQCFEAEHNTEEAVRRLRQAILADPKMAENYLDFANLALIHRSFAVGIDIVTLGIRQIPSSAPLYLARGILYVQLGKYDQSDQDFAKSEALDPSSFQASAAIGMQALQTSDLANGEARLRAQIAKQPSNALLYCLLGETILRRGASPGSAQFSEALRVTQKAVAIDPHLASARDLLGRLELQSGQIEKAIEESRLAVASNPDDQSALYHLISALRRSGKTSELPALAQRLSELRSAALKREREERKLALVEEPVR